MWAKIQWTVATTLSDAAVTLDATRGTHHNPVRGHPVYSLLTYWRGFLHFTFRWEKFFLSPVTESQEEIERIDRSFAHRRLGVSSMLRWFLFAALRRSTRIRIKKKLLFHFWWKCTKNQLPMAAYGEGFVAFRLMSSRVWLTMCSLQYRLAAAALTFACFDI